MVAPNEYGEPNPFAPNANQYGGPDEILSDDERWDGYRRDGPKTERQQNRQRREDAIFNQDHDPLNQKAGGDLSTVNPAFTPIEAGDPRKKENQTGGVTDSRGRNLT